MNKKIFLTGAALLGFLVCTGQSGKYAIITGKLIGFQESELQVNYDGASSILSNGRDILFHKKDDGSFTVKVPLEKPEYYDIFRNTLYLSPGDSLVVEISKNAHEAKFEGVGAIANTYMKTRLFPKEGSYLGAGRNIKPSLKATILYVDSMVQERLKIIDNLKGVSDEFRANERARIIADRVNSYLNYPSYSRNPYYGKSEEHAKAYLRDSLGSLVERDVALINKKEFLEVAVVRSILAYNRELYEHKITLIPEGVELFDAATIIARVDREPMTKALELKVEEIIRGSRNKEIIDELQNRLEKAIRLKAGKAAFDIKCVDANGNEVMLSSYKGKALYIDFWATWCGPCIAESPKFLELSKKYEKYSDKLQFIAISTDSDGKAWLKFLRSKGHPFPELNSMDTEALRSNWMIKFIPRFIVIDRNFKIVNAYAPRPSSGDEITRILDELVK